MGANTDPIYSRNGLLGTADITNSATALTTSNGAASTGVTGAAGEMFVCATADATNGSYIANIRLRWVASAPTVTTTTVVRLYISSVSSGATTNLNTDCFEEITMGAQTAASASFSTYPYDIPCGFILPAGKTILASVHQKPAANTEIQVIVRGGNY